MTNDLNSANNMTELNLIINLPSGSTKTASAICFFELSSEKYSIYTFNETDGNLTKVYVSKILENAGVFTTTVMNEDEWTSVKMAMREIIAGDITKFFSGFGVQSGDLSKGIKIETTGVLAMKYNYSNRNSIEKDPMVVVDENVPEPVVVPETVYSDNFVSYVDGQEKPLEALASDSVDLDNIFTSSMTPLEGVEAPSLENEQIVKSPEVALERVEEPTLEVEENSTMVLGPNLSGFQNSEEIEQVLKDIEDLKNSMRETVDEAKRYFDEESRKIIEKLMSLSEQDTQKIEPTDIVEDKLISTAELPKLSDENMQTDLSLTKTIPFEGNSDEQNVA